MVRCCSITLSSCSFVTRLSSRRTAPKEVGSSFGFIDFLRESSDGCVEDFFHRLIRFTMFDISSNTSHTYFMQFCGKLIYLCAFDFSAFTFHQKQNEKKYTHDPKRTVSAKLNQNFDK